MSPLAQQVYDYIRDQGGGVSFAQITELLGPAGKGTLGWSIAPNLYIWANMSGLFIDVMEEIRPLTDMLPTDVLVYMADGAYLRMPLAKRPTKKGYKTDHWTPVVFSLKKSESARGTQS